MKKEIYQFKIELLHIKPKIWRLINVPSSYNFWDLHVAIQDAMGWFDYHLHEYTFQTDDVRNPIRIGIPDEDTGDSVVEGWKTPITHFFTKVGDSCRYDYDFGDDWEHIVTFTGKPKIDRRRKYPYCVEGSRACPPEDVGGPMGYNAFIKVLKNKNDKRYDDIMFWLENHTCNYDEYDPDYFEPKDIFFWDPDERFKIAFGEEKAKF